MSPRPPRNLAIYALLAVFAFTVYLPGMWWGAPHATAPDRLKSWGVDDETPLGPLAEIHNIIQPKPDRNYGYPLMYSFTVAAAYTPYLAWLLASGQWTEISGVYPFGMTDPVSTLKQMTYIAHFVTLLMGIGMVLATFETGRLLGNRSTGVLAALFTMSLYPMFYYARMGNVDIPMLFFAALAMLFFTRSISLGITTRRAVWLGIFAGLALATKESAVGILLGIPFVLLLQNWREQSGRWTSWSFWRAPAFSLLAAFLALGIGSGLFIEPSRYFKHIAEIRSHIDLISAGNIFVPYVFPFSADGNISYLQRVLELLADIMSWPGLLLAVSGLGVILVQRSQARGLLFLMLTYLTVMFLTARSPQMRYFLPLAWLLTFPAALLLTKALHTQQRALRQIALLAGIGIVAFNLLRGAGLTYEMIHDSRLEAARWLLANTAAGDQIEYFGPKHEQLPPLPAHVTSYAATEYKGIYAPARHDDAMVEEILRGWKERRPKYIILIPDLTSPPGIDYNFTCPPQLCNGMLDGTRGFTEVATFKTAPLFSWLSLPALDYPTVNPPIHVFTLPEQGRS
jgi:hypothetical protein